MTSWWPQADATRRCGTTIQKRLAAKNDYRKTYIASYKESNTTRLRIAEHLRKLPMNFFNPKDLSELTTNMMADCSSMESLLSSTIPPLIANGITVTLTCILLMCACGCPR